MTPIAYVVHLFLYLYSRQAFLTEVVLFYKQPIRGSVGFVQANRSKALTNIRALGELQLSVGLLFAHQQIPFGVPQGQNGVCRTYTNFLCMVPILRRFRIVRCKRQAALHSGLFNYTVEQTIV